MSVFNPIFDDGSIQSKAFDDSRYEQLDEVINLTKDMSLNNDALIVNQKVEFRGNVVMGNSQIYISQRNNTNISTSTNGFINVRTDLDNLINLNLQGQITSQGNTITATINDSINIMNITK